MEHHIKTWAPINHDLHGCNEAAEGIVGAFNFADYLEITATLYHYKGATWGLICIHDSDDYLEETIGDSRTPMTLDEAKQLVNDYIHKLIED